MLTYVYGYVYLPEMPPVTLYAKDDEQGLWVEARAVAGKNGLSAFVAAAIREHLARRGAKSDESALALARRLVDRLEREQGHKKTARQRAVTRRRA